MEQEYYSKIFNIIVMEKSFCKTNYTIPKGYRPIVNTLGKLFKSIMAEKITYLAKIFNLLPDTQIGACCDKSIEFTLKLFTKQAHTVWGQDKNKIAILLSIKIAGAFDSVSYQ